MLLRSKAMPARASSQVSGGGFDLEAVRLGGTVSGVALFLADDFHDEVTLPHADVVGPDGPFAGSSRGRW